MNEHKCPDCDFKLIVPLDYKNGEIFDCPCCGLEMEYKNGDLIELTLDGLDYGE